MFQAPNEKCWTSNLFPLIQDFQRTQVHAFWMRFVRSAHGFNRAASLERINCINFSSQCLAIQASSRPQLESFWTLMHCIMGLYMPMHSCNPHCQFLTDFELCKYHSLWLQIEGLLAHFHNTLPASFAPHWNPLNLKENLRNFNLKFVFESQLLEIQELQNPKPCNLSNHFLLASKVWSDRVWSKPHKKCKTLNVILIKLHIFNSTQFSGIFGCLKFYQCRKEDWVVYRSNGSNSVDIPQNSTPHIFIYMWT
jgi:hypothetical protein